MPCAAETGLSVALLLLDDMRFDQLEHLSRSNERLAEHAVVFERAYVTVPMCCPERASFLSGGFLPQYTGVLTNEAPRGGATVFADGETLATELQRAGYATALYGKYLNEYMDLGMYVPPGWSDWAVVTEGDSWSNFRATVGSSTPDAAGEAREEDVARYVTEWQASIASDFVVSQEEPFFLLLSFRAPHDPHVPQASDRGAFGGYEYRGGAWQEADVSDKPAWIQALPLLTDEEVETLDRQNAERLETLLAVDRAIERFVDALERAGRLESTLILITSDNGQLWGEHRLLDKGVGYEEAVRVPLVAWSPSFRPRHTDDLVAANLDLAATIKDIAGLPASGDGASLRSVLCEEDVGLRDYVPLQGWPYSEPAWAGLVTDRWKFLESGTGEVELYDLTTDPWEMENVSPVHPDVVAELSGVLEPLKGLAITTQSLSPAIAGEAYFAHLSAWGGQGEQSWRVLSGTMPDGVTLASDGTLSGTPKYAGAFVFTSGVSDETVSPFHGGPQTDQRTFQLVVDPAQPRNKEKESRSRCGCDGPSGEGSCREGGAASGILALLTMFGVSRRTGGRAQQSAWSDRAHPRGRSRPAGPL